MNAEIENLRIPLAAIRRGGEKPREISLTTSLDDLQIGLSKINDGKVEVNLELIPDGNKINAQGLLLAEWTAECRRCLEPVEGELKLNVSENFVEEGKTFDAERIEASEKTDFYFFNESDLNLEPLIRDAVLLALPLSPLCESSCQGSEPEEFPVVRDETSSQNDEKGDPRWAVLDRLKE
ncbi:MAG: DUF177 domain-containing protein [Acidimicrobiales bacterium]|nr:hypothetical protein [Acidimicrobiaceae bacterium]MDP6162549.1 DUF177 domain-containing protein [Acidimicrobiales bacterium]